MSNVGGFREGEIDGKPFLIFTFLTQPEDPSSSLSSETTTLSGGNNDLLQPQFICPNLRIKAEELKLEENGYASNGPSYIPMSISPHFPTKDQHVQYLLDSHKNIGSDSESEICKLPVVPLFWCNNKENIDGIYECKVCNTSTNSSTNYYFCVTCDEKFHKECVESPSQIKHSSYPFLSFQLSGCTERYWECGCCKENISAIGYHRPTSIFGLHPVCALKPTPMVINYPKRHPDHPLTLFPKQAYLPCTVCGLIIESIPTYLCVPCVSVVHQFVVHQDCANAPTVIKISRHHHRVSFTLSLPLGEWSCGVCRKEMDNNYGAYSCNKCDGYFVHTRCALRRDLWDGEELEGVPEEPEIVVPSFEVIAEGIILHFAHGHHLKLGVSRIYDKDKFCQACVLPIYEGNYYSCMDQCDFILHEVCANASRRKHHPLHARPLTLMVVTNQYQYVDRYARRDKQGYFKCDACWRSSCALVYENNRDFKLDFRCALVSEPFEYPGHKYPLFLALTPEEDRAARCQICHQEDRGSISLVRKLNCIKSDFVICFRCATLPYKVRYKHDKHLLTFHKEKVASDEFGWCESCEKRIVYSRDGGFYSCDDNCGTTLHVDCLIGRDPYMKPGQTLSINEKEIHIVRNNTMSRPLCHNCRDRCLFGVVYKKENNTYCCLDCAY